MNFRLATAADTNEIAALRMQMLREVADTIPPELPDAIVDYLKKHLEDKTCICALGEADGAVVAKAMLCVYDAMPDERNVSGKCARLFSVYTVPSFRGKGCMEKLLGYLLDAAKENGIREIFASAEEKAIPLYQRLGFDLSETEMHLCLQ